ncbi:glycosyl hydrolase family 28-related protein [Paenibacillus sp. FSL R7-0333]|uniref:glycosyl hydrolase family 28-related protein n=1 Tax=Paenibacillus sp. FSL R7-0333 TaxID=1926587 RepID=UPI00096C3DE4|nr:hypothetical protein BK146_18000 [Paenibacillus sp. FSL R7-0333]
MTLPWRGTTPEISSEADSRYETPGGAQNKVDESAEEINTKLNLAIITGDSGPEAATARYSTPYGVIYPILKDRLDATDMRILNLKQYNVRDFGAKGDGVTDDTAAIQNCIDTAISAGGGTIYFPAGTYLLASVQSIGMTPWAIQDPNLFISNASNIKLIGDGNAILTTAYPANRTEIVFVYKSTNIEVSGIQFKGNNTGLLPENNNCGFGAVSTVNLNLHDCQFYGFQGSYLGCSWLFDSTIERCEFTVSGGSAVDVAFLQNVTFRNNYLIGSGLGSNELGTNGIQIIYDIPNQDRNETGVLLVGGITNNVTIDNNKITGFGTGINLSDLVDTKVINNNIFNNYIATDSQSWGIVIGNTRSDFTMEGILIYNNSIYQNGSEVSGGGITIGAGTALGVIVELSYNNFFDNSHIGLNIGSSNVTLRGSNNRFYNRFNENQTTKTAGFSQLTNKSNFVNNEGFNPIPPTLPAVPSGITSADAVMNANPFPVTIYQAGGVGLHIISPSGVDIAVSGGDQTMFRLLPYQKAYFSITNTIQWNWVFE